MKLHIVRTGLERRRNLAGEGIIYFVQAGDKVKIGYCEKNLHVRFCSLQTGCPETLVLLGALPNSSMARERTLHHKFRKSRLRGEWFTLTEDIKLFIAEKTKLNTWDGHGNWLGMASTPELRKYLRGR